VIVQIYGVTTPEDAAMVDAAGPDNVGVVLDEGIDTWDSVDEATMRTILPELRDTTVVALSLSTERDRILRTVACIEPAIVHLARAWGGLDLEALARLRDDLAPIQLMLTVPVRDATAVDAARALAPLCDALLLDSAHPRTGVVGASGLTHDWSHSRSVVDAVDVPVVLAGGLGPENVREAIRRVGPAGVDSETRTSRHDDRRRKDPEKVRQFIARAREAAEMSS
jgi:phosphoribosylanthranilate isomerase